MKRIVIFSGNLLIMMEIGCLLLNIIWENWREKQEEIWKIQKILVRQNILPHSIIMPDSSLDRIHLLCPDPWPKMKHKGNRLLSSDFMMQLARVLKPGGVFHFATDDEPYLKLGMANVESSGLFTPGGEISDVADIKTEFERQWLAEGKTVTHIAWTKK